MALAIGLVSRLMMRSHYAVLEIGTFGIIEYDPCVLHGHGQFRKHIRAPHGVSLQQLVYHVFWINVVLCRRPVWWFCIVMPACSSLIWWPFQFCNPVVV